MPGRMRRGLDAAATGTRFAAALVRAVAGDRFLWRLAWRNVWRNGRRTTIVVTAVAVGIAGAVVSMAINFGMVYQMIDTAIRTDLGHLQIHAPGFRDDPGLDRVLPDGGGPEVRALGELKASTSEALRWAPRVRADGLVTAPRASAGVRMVAVDPEREPGITVLADSVTAGAYLDGEPRRVLLGEALAERLHVDVGSKVVLSATDARGDLAAEAFRVGGLFRTSSLELDRSTVYLRLDEAQQMFALDGAISELAVVTDAGGGLDALQRALERRLGDRADVEVWSDIAPLLDYFVQVFDQMAWIVYAAIFIAMAFGIANVLLMAVFERTREIGVIRAVGMSGPRVVAMVTLESLLLTCVGLVAGFALTGLGLFALRDGIDLSRWAQGMNALGVGSTLVPVMRWRDVVAPCAVAVVTALVAGLWPALRAARARPADALRHV